MKIRMTQNAFLVFFLTNLFVPSVFATAETPVVQGLGGAGRAGIPSEANFSNPAVVAGLTQSAAFYFYQKPQIPDWNAGGRLFGFGAYDGGSTSVKGSFVYLRNSRARVLPNGTQGYEDRTEYRFAMATSMGSIKIGIQPKYIIRQTGETNTKVFDGDLGAIFPIFTDIQGGITYENALKKVGEKAPTVGAGVVYAVGSGIQVYADGMRQMDGIQKGERGWAVGAESGLWGELRARAGRFQDVFKRKKGWAVGASWTGPRTSFDYSMRTTGDSPYERDHTLGMKILF
jgi:hypothetical protein